MGHGTHAGAQRSPWNPRARPRYAVTGTVVRGVGGTTYAALVTKRRARRQHVLSKFYLRGFAEDGQLTRVPTDGGSPHAISLNDATVVRDFYSVETDEGELSDYFELAFAGVEQKAAPVLAAVLDGQWPLDCKSKEALATWIALQYLRTEAIRNSQTQIAAMLTRLVVGASGKKALRVRIERAEGNTISDARLDAEWADLTKRGGPTVAPDVDAHIRTILELTPPTAALLAHSQWSLDVFRRKVLLTSDHPVILVPEPGHPANFGVGLANAGAYGLALSRSLGLVIMGPNYVLPDMRVPGSTALARALNAGAILNARKAVFHHPDDAHLLDGVTLRPRIEEIEMGGGDHFVQEQGFFAGVEPDAFDAIRSAEGGGEGMTLADLEWPIPGRRFEWVEPSP